MYASLSSSQSAAAATAAQFYIAPDLTDTAGAHDLLLYYVLVAWDPRGHAGTGSGRETGIGAAPCHHHTGHIHSCAQALVFLHFYLIWLGSHVRQAVNQVYYIVLW